MVFSARWELDFDRYGNMKNRDGKVENCVVLQELVTTVSLKAPRFLINHISKFSQLEGKSNSMIAAVFPARSRSSVLVQWKHRFLMSNPKDS